MVINEYGQPPVAVPIARYALPPLSSASGWPIAKINRDFLTLWYKAFDMIMQMLYLLIMQAGQRSWERWRKMKSYLGLTAKKALKLAQPTEMRGGEIFDTLVLRGVRYIVEQREVETPRGYADVVMLDSEDRHVVLYF